MSDDLDGYGRRPRLEFVKSLLKLCNAVLVILLLLSLLSKFMTLALELFILLL